MMFLIGSPTVTEMINGRWECQVQGQYGGMVWASAPNHEEAVKWVIDNSVPDYLGDYITASDITVYRLPKEKPVMYRMVQNSIGAWDCYCGTQGNPERHHCPTEGEAINWLISAAKTMNNSKITHKQVEVVYSQTVSESRGGQPAPSHYGSKEIQPFEVWKAYMTGDELRGAYWSNVLKYVMRWKGKNGVEDLKKATHYLELLVNHEEAK